TAKPTVARVGAALAVELGVASGDSVTVSTDAGWYTLAVEVTPNMTDGTVWVPMNSPGTPIGELGVAHGGDVALSRGGEE
ncbi:MAG: hypothetical protein LWW77_02675, partial [Propionibacteriales bacterium]|nr:hypothetical protein [Propionibacteriales bacterium]